MRILWHISASNFYYACILGPNTHTFFVVGVPKSMCDLWHILRITISDAKFLGPNTHTFF